MVGKDCFCAEGAVNSYLDALQGLWVSIQGECDCQRREREGKPRRNFHADLELANQEQIETSEKDKTSGAEVQQDQGVTDEIARKAWVW